MVSPEGGRRIVTELDVGKNLCGETKRLISSRGGLVSCSWSLVALLREVEDCEARRGEGGGCRV